MTSTTYRNLTRCLAITAVCLCACWRFAAAEEPFDYYSNSWNVVGLKDYERGARLAPNNAILFDIANMASDGADKAVIRYGKDRLPLSQKQIKTLREGWMPIVLLSTADGAVRYDFTIWATPLPTVVEWEKAYDWPTEGENFLVWVLVKAANTGGEKAEANIVVERGKGKHERNWSLAPGQAVEDCFRLPFKPVIFPQIFEKEDPKVWLERTANYWRGLLGEGAVFEVPCRKSQDALRAAHVCQFLVSDHAELHGGEGFYDEFYIRDAAYQLMELEEAGLDRVAARCVLPFLRYQFPDGRFGSQERQWDANGQAQWVFWQYAKITGDRTLLEKAYPQMLAAARWTVKARNQRRADSPSPGILPPSFGDGESLWDGKHHIVGADIWNLRGMLSTADAARMLGKDADAKELTDEAAAYRQAIDAAWKKTGVAYFPPSWETDGTFWGSTETLWPTPLFAADDPRVIATIDHVRNVFGGGFHEGTIRFIRNPKAPVPKGANVIHPYMSAYTTMASLALGDDEQVVKDFYWYLLHSSASHAFPEGIYWESRTAWRHLIPHPTGAANYAFLLRHMLVHEADDELQLLRAVPDWWLGDGQTIRLVGAPTWFGKLDMTVRGKAGGVEVKFAAPGREPPKRIVLCLPKSRPLLNALPGVEVVYRDDQRERWDFATVVQQYKQLPKTD